MSPGRLRGDPRHGGDRDPGDTRPGGGLRRGGPGRAVVMMNNTIAQQAPPGVSPPRRPLDVAASWGYRDRAGVGHQRACRPPLPSRDLPRRTRDVCRCDQRARVPPGGPADGGESPVLTRSGRIGGELPRARRPARRACREQDLLIRVLARQSVAVGDEVTVAGDAPASSSVDTGLLLKICSTTDGDSPSFPCQSDHRRESQWLTTPRMSSLSSVWGPGARDVAGTPDSGVDVVGIENRRGECPIGVCPAR